MRRDITATLWIIQSNNQRPINRYRSLISATIRLPLTTHQQNGKRVSEAVISPTIWRYLTMLQLESPRWPPLHCRLLRSSLVRKPKGRDSNVRVSSFTDDRQRPRPTRSDYSRTFRLRAVLTAALIQSRRFARTEIDANKLPTASGVPHSYFPHGESNNKARWVKDGILIIA